MFELDEIFLEKPNHQVVLVQSSIFYWSKLKTTLQNPLRVWKKIVFCCSLVRLSFSHLVFSFWPTTALLLSVRDRRFAIVKDLLILVTRRNRLLWLRIPKTYILYSRTLLYYVFFLFLSNFIYLIYVVNLILEL
jgi:hypothetical protein